MISRELNQPRFAQFAAEILADTGDRLLKQQSDIADIYLHHTGWLAEKLASGIYTVVSNADGANMTINYPKYIRFLDLKKTRSGRKKKVYHPIYNRPLYGFVYGYTLARLRAALNSNIRDAIAAEGKLTVNISV
jgi:hypothetical protein